MCSRLAGSHGGFLWEVTFFKLTVHYAKTPIPIGGGDLPKNSPKLQFSSRHRKLLSKLQIHEEDGEGSIEKLLQKVETRF